MQLFPAAHPLESVAADILDTLPRRQRGYGFILFISYQFRKLIQVVPLPYITA